MATASGAQTVVVGGGLAGIVSARLLAENGQKVSLVEREDTCGGLLRSLSTDGEFTFDYGTHFALTTGIDALDEMLFEDMSHDEWHIFTGSLKEGHYFNGHFYGESGCPDVRTLPAQIYRQGVAELMSATPATTVPENLEVSLLASFGKTFTNKVFRPVMRKFTGSDLSQLHPETHKGFGLSRLIVFDAERSSELKKDPFFDDRIAFTDSSHGVSTIKKYYPRSGGIDRWLNYHIGKLKDLGVDILTERLVSNITFDDDTVRAVTLSDGADIACDELIWTLPTALLLRLSGRLQNGSAPPSFRNVLLFHFVFDQPVQIDDHWITCYDDTFLTYRATLYPNITNDDVAPPPHRVTVEVLSGETGDLDVMIPRIRSELIELGVIDQSAKTVYQFAHAVERALPVTTTDFHTAAQAQRAVVRDTYSNVRLFGQAGGGNKMISLLHEIWDTSGNARLGEPRSFAGK